MVRQNWRSGLLMGSLLLFIGLLLLSEHAARTDNLPLTPQFSHPTGYYDDDFLLKITAPPEATVFFTLDGSIPLTTTSTIYTEPILVSGATAVTPVRALTLLPDGQVSPVMTATYIVGVESDLPLLSLVVNPDDLFNPTTGLYTNPLNRGEEWERKTVVTYIDKNRRDGFQIPAGLRVSGNASRTDDKKAWRVYFREEYGQNRLTYPLFEDGFNSFKRLVIHSGAQDASNPAGTLLRAHLLSDLAEEIGLVASQTQPVLLFINGQSEGIYLLRNRIDDRFLADKYGIQTLPEEEMIGRWQNLLEFANTHDLNDPDNYAYVTTQLDINNFIDYLILQIYAANTDWIATNMRAFQPNGHGGHIQWIIWDMDWGFGLGFQTGPEFDMMTWFVTNERPGFENNARFIQQLWQNPDFQRAFLIRADELLASTLAGEKVAKQIDALAAELRPEIHHEIGRWSYEKDWEANVGLMREFALQRPSYLRQHFTDYFD